MTQITKSLVCFCQLSPKDQKALDIISVVALSISIICLAITLIILIILRYVDTVGPILSHTYMCVWCSRVAVLVFGSIVTKLHYVKPVGDRGSC